VDTKRMNADAVRCIARIGLNVAPTTKVGVLSIAQQQMVEIAKALSHDARVLIMDEPTSSLTEAETVQLFRIIEELRADGVAILYISHRLDEMAQIVDRVTVLRDGRHISTDDFADVSIDDIVARMVGRTLDDAYP
ncbi:TPA: ATP-binding cassette domain-containing protein, partial [Burkholderia contaminans]